MTIVVAHKWAANPQDAAVLPDGSVDWSRAKPSLSDYDAVAIELARAVADELAEELVGVSAGGPDAASAMAKKSALSRGLDRTVVVAHEALADADTTTTGLVLAAVVRRLPGVRLVVTGDSSLDVAAQLVPAVLAGALGWPSLGNVRSVTASAGDLLVERQLTTGTQTLRLTGPAVVSVSSGAVTPRLPAMKDILAAARKPAQDVALDSLDLPPLPQPVVTATGAPQRRARRGVVIDGSDPAAAATRLVAALRADGTLPRQATLAARGPGKRERP